MKRTLLFAIGILFLLFSCTKSLEYEGTEAEKEISGNVVNVTVSVPGTLSSVLGNIGQGITKLTVKGTLNGTDVLFLRKLCGTDDWGNETEGTLECLDLSNCSMVAGGEPYYYYNTTPIYQKENEISRYAFGYCSSLKQIVLPSTITRIGPQAFFECGNLEIVAIRSDIKEIGRSAFYNCMKLTQVNLPDGIQFVDDYVFYNCKKLVSLNLSNVKNVGNASFYGCFKLTELDELIKRLDSFGNFAFFACNKIEAVELSDKIHKIPDYAFQNCSSLSNIVLKDKIDSIGKHAFHLCPINGHLKLPKGLRYLGMGAFYKTNISQLTIQSDISVDNENTVDLYASEIMSDKLSTISVENGCTLLELHINAKNLKEVSLPSSLKRIGKTGIVYHGDYNFSGCKSLEKINFPDSLEYISS